MSKKKWIVRTAVVAVLSSMMMVNAACSVEAAKKISFSDVPKGHWAESSILKTSALGIAQGVGNGTFKPNTTISRAEFAKMVLTAAEKKVPERAKGEKWYIPYVKAAKAEGIYKNSDFSVWTDPITRQEMSNMIVRALDPKLKNASSKQLMYEATKRGIITGLTNGELGPDEKSTRAQAAVIIDRLLTAKSGGKLTVDKRAASYAEVAFRGTNLETMWGGKMNPLPQTHDLSYAVRGTFEQILIIDMDDPKGPYWEWAKDAVKINGKPYKGDYLVAYKVTMETIKEAPKTRIYFDYVASNPYFVRAVILKEGSPLAKRDYLELKQGNKVTVWHLATISKKELNEFKKKNSPFWYFDWTISRNFKLAPEGRIFG